mmetsp:Transcript_23615/g.80678  ORF Transcript_23615/g.80678 Transcript_23615/m.80678 type:complete len:132 (-) Transcript_23615:233-628(-)
MSPRPGELVRTGSWIADRDRRFAALIAEGAGRSPAPFDFANPPMYERRETLSRSSRGSETSLATDSTCRGSRGSDSDILGNACGDDESASRRNSSHFDALVLNAFDQQSLDSLQTPRMPDHYTKKSDAHER